MPVRHVQGILGAVCSDRVVKCLVLIGTTLGVAPQFTMAQDLSIVLGRPTDASITASILFHSGEEYYIEYGTSPGLYTVSTPLVVNVPGAPDEVDLNGLVPDTRYYYRLQYRPVGTTPFTATPEYTFHTQRAPGSAFTFTVEADEHLYDQKGVESLYRITLANQALDQPDLMLSLGDIFGDDHEPFTITSGALDTLHANYRPLLGAITHSIPFYVCLGNHEGENDYYLAQNPPNNLAVWGTLWRKFYYPNPYPNGFYSGNTTVEPWAIGEPENYYAWSWGDALFVVLDVYRDQNDTTAMPGGWNWSLGWPQYEWLRNTLQASTAPHKFVFAHHVRGWDRGGIGPAHYFEWGGYAGNGTTFSFPNKRQGWDMPIQQLFETYGVDIFFQGHDHLFAREELNGVVYQEVPMPSDSTYTLGMVANADAYTADTLEGSGHLRVNVTPQCITVDFVRAYLPADTVAGLHRNREVAFSYSIGNCAVGVDDRPMPSGLVVHPVPADDHATLRLPEGLTHPRITILDAMGRVVLVADRPVLETAGWSPGTYTVHVQDQDQLLTTRFIVSR